MDHILAAARIGVESTMHKLLGSPLALAGILSITFTPGMYAQQVAPADLPTITTPASDLVLTKPVEELTPAQIAAMQKKLADWPQLARYHDDDATLGDPRPGDARVVFLGDSITDGWGRIHGKFFPDQPWVNRGISGQTTPQMVLRFQQDVLALNPKAVVILAGINDIAGNTGPESLATIEDNFRSMVSLAKAAHVSVVLSSVLPAARFPWHPGIDPRAEVVKLNSWIQQFAAEQKLVYLDYYPAMVAADGGMKPELGVDGVHPNDAGYAIMEPLARAAVAKALAQPKP
jgi:lysophospholipase L1-like esterase